MKHKSYFIEEDIFELSGADVLQRLGEKDNILYLDLPNLISRANNTKDPYQSQFQQAVSYLNSGIIEGETILLESEGEVQTKIPNSREGIVHITKTPGKKLEHKLNGYATQDPEFLKYGTEVFSTGFQSINLDEYLTNPSLEELEEKTQKIFKNNQYLMLNEDEQRGIYKVEKKLFKAPHGRYIEEDSGVLIPLDYDVGMLNGFEPRNLEQRLAYYQGLDDSVEISFIMGGSGSGKSVVTYAAALDLLLGGGSTSYDGIVLFKSNDIIGGQTRELGFLPGTAYDKVKPFMKSYMDAHALLGLNNEIPFRELLADPFDENDEFGKRERNSIHGRALPKNNKAIEIEHLQFVRGRTFENKIIFVDEAQNYSPFEVKQLLERAGTGSKMFIVGDPLGQIDNPKLSPEFNGMVFAANHLYDKHPRVAFTQLDQNYRSQTAELMRLSHAPKD